MLVWAQKRLWPTRSMSLTLEMEMMSYRYCTELFTLLIYIDTSTLSGWITRQVRLRSRHSVWWKWCPVWQWRGHLWEWGSCGGCSPWRCQCLLQCWSRVWIWTFRSSLTSQHLRGNSNCHSKNFFLLSVNYLKSCVFVSFWK